MPKITLAKPGPLLNCVFLIIVAFQLSQCYVVLPRALCILCVLHVSRNLLFPCVLCLFLCSMCFCALFTVFPLVRYCFMLCSLCSAVFIWASSVCFVLNCILSYSDPGEKGRYNLQEAPQLARRTNKLVLRILDVTIQSHVSTT